MTPPRRSITSTPTRFASEDTESDTDYEKSQRGVRLLSKAVGENPARDALGEIWKHRVPDVFTTFPEGQRESAKPTRTFDAETNNLIAKTRILVYALCEHHLLSFFRTVHLARRPTDEVVELSKLTRYVRWHSCQLTMQKQLTNNITSGLGDELNRATILIEMYIIHLYEVIRGIEAESTTNTRATVREPTETEREQFYAAINRTEGGQ